jgi:S-(hydroxymethyl)glutathione dehydrogenase/alcohol dehydrogenase
VIAIDISDDKLECALVVGATHVVNAGDRRRGGSARAHAGGVDYSFEAIGTKPTAEQCFAMLGRHGTGSNMGSNRFRFDMPWFCDLYLDGRLKFDEMVSAHRPLAEINEGYDVLRRGEGARTVIHFST